jgi:hypothetical protein
VTLLLPHTTPKLGPWLAAEVPDLVGRGVIDAFKK